MSVDVILSFCREYDYPDAVRDALLQAYQAVTADETAADLLKRNGQMLWQDQFSEIGDDLVLLDQIAEIVNIHPYTIHLLFYVLCAPKTKQLYIQRNLPLDIYRSSMLAVKWKMQKTHKLYGVWGSGWAAWFRPFFQLRRFGIGRLEFELSPSLADYKNGDYEVHKGDTVINVHIPAAGPLDHSAVLRSYQMAAQFFREVFPSGVIPFQCATWLLYPPILEMVPKGNLWAFSQDYEVIAVEDVSPEDDRWRVFHVPETVPVEDYPEQTSLQRKLKAWLLEGNSMGSGLGMFFYTSDVDAAHTHGHEKRK